MLVSVRDSRAQVNRGDFEYLGRTLYHSIRERKRKRDDVCSVLWDGVELQLENIRHELLAKGNLFQCPVAILALRSAMRVFPASEPGPTRTAHIKALSASPFAEHNH